MKEGSKVWEEEFFKGFNNGYRLAQHEPELAKTITKSFKGFEILGPRAEGFMDGIEIYEKELIREMRPEWMRERTEERESDTASPERDIEPDR